MRFRANVHRLWIPGEKGLGCLVKVQARAWGTFFTGVCSLTGAGRVRLPTHFGFRSGVSQVSSAVRRQPGRSVCLNSLAAQSILAPRAGCTYKEARAVS